MTLARREGDAVPYWRVIAQNGSFSRNFLAVWPVMANVWRKKVSSLTLWARLQKSGITKRGWPLLVDR
jgi:hypothetical protein